MVVTCNAVFDEKGRIINIEPGKLAGFRKAHKRGEAVRIIFDDSIERWSDRQSRFFHALVNAYAKEMGEAAPIVKVTMKYLFGSYEPFPFRGTPPHWKQGAFVELPKGYPDKLIYLKSVTVYDKHEWKALIDGTIQACYDNHVDIDEIVKGASA